jgi:hypothetical protein
VRLSRAVLPLVLICAPLVALAAPGQAERALRLATVGAVAALVIDLIRWIGTRVPPDGANPFAVLRPAPDGRVLPAGLIELERDVRLAGMSHLPGRSSRPERVRAVAVGAARRRLARHGLDLDDPADADQAQAVLGDDVWRFVTGELPTIDVRVLVTSLEAR